MFFFPLHMFCGNGTTFNTPTKHMRPYSKLGRQITGIRRVLLSRRRISETAGGSPRFASVPDSARVSTPPPGKPLITAAQRRRLKGMLPVVCLSRLAAVLLPAPGGAHRLSSAPPPSVCQGSRVRRSDAEGLFTVVPWGERDVK